MQETSTAESSAAAEVDVFQGQSYTAAEYNQYRETGEVPARFKPAATEESAASQEEPSEGEQPESAGESETPEDQHQEPKPQPKKLTAEGRIAQIDATLEKLWAQDEPDVIKIAQLEATKDKIEQRAGLKRKAEPAPATQPQASAAKPQAEPQYTRPKPTAEDKDKDGNPKYATYEAWVEDVAEWKAEQKLAQYQRQQAEQAAINALRTKLDDARTRYEDADEVIFPAAQTIHEANIPQAVKQVIADSDVFPDLCYVLGENREELQKFVALAQNNPRVALAKVFEYERGIREALDGTSAANESGNTAPEPKRTQAPKPPSPVGGASSRSFDVNDESLTPEQWAEKRNKQLARK